MNFNKVQKVGCKIADLQMLQKGTNVLPDFNPFLQRTLGVKMNEHYLNTTQNQLKMDVLFEKL